MGPPHQLSPIQTKLTSNTTNRLAAEDPLKPGAEQPPPVPSAERSEPQVRRLAVDSPQGLDLGSLGDLWVSDSARLAVAGRSLATQQALRPVLVVGPNEPSFPPK